MHQISVITAGWFSGNRNTIHHIVECRQYKRSLRTTNQDIQDRPRLSTVLNGKSTALPLSACPIEMVEFMLILSFLR